MNFVESIISAIRNVETMYHRLIVIVGEQGAGKTKLLQAVSHEMKKPLINVNLELSKRLLDLPEKKRKLEARAVLADILDGTASNIVLLDNAELLFDTNLSLDPLRLLQNLSRNRTLVVSWNGHFKNNYLIYAEPDHPEYKKEETSGEIVIEIPIKKNFEIEL